MNTLAKKLRPGAFPLFDYAGLNDPDLERGLRASTTRIRELRRAAIVDIGRELVAAKERLPHGQFMLWVEAEFGWNRSTASRMMNVATVFGDTWCTVQHLQPGTLYLLAAPSTPPEVRSTVLENIGPGRVVSTENVRELIDSVKTSELRKHRRDRREEEKQEREAYRLKWEKQYAKDMARREQERAAALDAAEQVRSMLGGYYPEVCDLLIGISRHDFADALFKMAESDRIRRNAEGRS